MNQAQVSNKPRYAQVNIIDRNSQIANKICDDLKAQFGDVIQTSFGTDYDVVYITVTGSDVSVDGPLKQIISESDFELAMEKTDEDIHLGLGGPLTSRKGHFYRLQPKR